jgi:two-component system, NarL family, nitrate/nitrite response regulator NarL
MPRAVDLTRISIVEDHELFAESLELALTLQGHAVQRVPVNEQTNPDRLVAAVVRQRPQVVVLDLDLGPAGDGTRLIAPLREAGLAVAVVSGTTDRARLGACLRLGARAVLSKSASLNTVLAGIRHVAQGRPAMPLEEREELLACHARQHRSDVAARERLDTLSQREAEVLASLMAGYTVQDIARRSYVSEATVRTQVKAVRAKLGVHSQLAAVGIAQRVQWQPPALPLSG